MDSGSHRVPQPVRSLTAVLLFGAVLCGGDSRAQTVNFPFSDDFESGVLQPYWTVSTTGQGYADVTSSYSPNGGFHCVMASSSSGVDSIVSITVSIDLTNQESVLVEFNHKEFSDENDVEDGVFVSDDGGSTWFEALSLQNTSSLYTKKVIDLDSIAAANGLTYNSDFRIRFQWNDNYNLTTDGFAFDDIAVRPLDYTVFYVLNGGAANDDMGRSVSDLGDFDGDGLGDFIVGIPNADPLSPNDNVGVVRIVSGLTGMTLHDYIGFESNASFGFATASAGDVDQNGVADVVVGSYLSDLNGTNSGSAFLFSGESKLLLTGYASGVPGDYVGYSVAGVGDVDGDGVPDVAVGMPRADSGFSDAGVVRVYSGQTNQILHEWSGTGFGDQFGFSVAGIGDVTLDGFPDVLIGSPYDDDFGTNSGSASIYNGATGGFIDTFFGDSSSDNLGYAVAGLGDLNSDGFADVAVGAPFDDKVSTNSGSVNVYLAPVNTPFYTVSGGGSSDSFGTSIAGVGDVNLDGISDFIVGAPSTSSSQPGYARLHSGLSGGEIRTFSGDAGNERYGTSVASAGDTNGDTVPDVVVGAPWESNTGSKSGAVRVISSLAAPVVNTIEGVKALDSGEVIVRGDNFVNSVTVLLDGQPVTPSSITTTEIRLPVGPEDPGLYDLEVSTALGTVDLESSVPRYPALETSSAILGQDLTITLDNGEVGVGIVMVSPLLFQFPLVLPGIYHGLWLQQPIVLATSNILPSNPLVSLDVPVPGNPSFDGVTLYLQGFAVQGILPLNTSSFTNLETVVLTSFQ